MRGTLALFALAVGLSLAVVGLVVARQLPGPRTQSNECGEGASCSTPIAPKRLVTLARAELDDGRRIRLRSFRDSAGPCLSVVGLDASPRQCGRPPSTRRPAFRGDLLAGPTAQRAARAPLEIYGETSSRVSRVVLNYRVRGRARSQDALLLRANEPVSLIQAGIRKPFGYFVAELPSAARAVTATALDTGGDPLAAGNYRAFADLHPCEFIARGCR